MPNQKTIEEHLDRLTDYAVETRRWDYSKGFSSGLHPDMTKSELDMHIRDAPEWVKEWTFRDQVIERLLFAHFAELAKQSRVLNSKDSTQVHRNLYMEDLEHVVAEQFMELIEKIDGLMNPANHHPGIDIADMYRDEKLLFKEGE